MVNKQWGAYEYTQLRGTWSDKYKERFIAKCYSQKQGTDYERHFQPSADMTSVRVIMQKAAQEDLVLHQMNVKTAYLHTPIDCEIYIEQSEGYVKKITYW